PVYGSLEFLGKRSTPLGAPFEFRSGDLSVRGEQGERPIENRLAPQSVKIIKQGRPLEIDFKSVRKRQSRGRDSTAHATDSHLRVIVQVLCRRVLDKPAFEYPAAEYRVWHPEHQA